MYTIPTILNVEDYIWEGVFPAPDVMLLACISKSLSH